MEINVTGTFSIAKAVALEMKKADVSGSMVLVASMSGTVANKVSMAPSHTHTHTHTQTHTHLLHMYRQN
jgi:NAD(P)-dependent dehydrogenase (short-subunit alcohol dehydrogenase family)